MKYIFIVFFFVFILGCNNQQPISNTGKNDSIKSANIKYAKGFEISCIENGILLSVKNPWQGAKNIKFDYILSEKNNLNKTVSRNSTQIIIPIKRAICLSTTHISFIDFNEEINSVVGISGSQYICNETIRKNIKKELVKDVGYDQNLNFELILSLKPDVVFAYGVGGDISAYINKLKELGIKVVMVAEYLETSPLAKAEWCKFFSYFFNKQKLAEQKFEEIEKKYLALKKITDTIREKPTVFTDLPWNGVWYIAGGKTITAEYIRDAGGNYLWKENTSHESFPLDMERIYERAKNADFWINTGSANSKDEIKKIDYRLSEFKAFKQNKIFNYNAKVIPSGGNDFWESGVTNPDLILKDLISIFHPDYFNDYKPVYYKKIN